MRKQENAYQVLSNPGVLPITFLTISGELEEILEEKELEEELRREILEFYFIVRDFLNVSELVDGKLCSIYRILWRRMISG